MRDIGEMLKDVNWTAHPEPDRVLDDTPYATHEGSLDVLGVTLRVFRLSNGQAVIEEESLAALLSVALVPVGVGR